MTVQKVFIVNEPDYYCHRRARSALSFVCIPLSTHSIRTLITCFIQRAIWFTSNRAPQNDGVVEAAALFILFERSKRVEIEVVQLSHLFSLPLILFILTQLAQHTSEPSWTELSWGAKYRSKHACNRSLVTIKIPSAFVSRLFLLHHVIWDWIYKQPAIELSWA